jgi:hypothetical protein
VDVNYVLYSISTYTFASPSPVTDVTALMFLRSVWGIFVGGGGINTESFTLPHKREFQGFRSCDWGSWGDLYESTSHLTVPTTSQVKLFAYMYQCSTRQ